jgi:hypothetical protein
MRVKGHFVKRSTESKTTPVATMEEACLTTSSRSRHARCQ